MELNEQSIIELFSFLSSDLTEGDYIKNGIPYCGKCNTPKAYLQDDFGGWKTSTIRISCEMSKKRFEQDREEERKFFFEKKN